MEVRSEHTIGSRGRSEVLDKLFERGVCLPGEFSCERTAEEVGKERRPVGGRVEDSLVEQVLEHGLAPEIDDEGDFRARQGYVREILFRPHADIGAAGPGEFPQPVGDVQVGGLVRGKIVGTEKASGLGKVPDQPRKLLQAVSLESRGGIPKSFLARRLPTGERDGQQSRE